MSEPQCAKEGDGRYHIAFNQLIYDRRSAFRKWFRRRRVPTRSKNTISSGTKNYFDAPISEITVDNVYKANNAPQPVVQHTPHVRTTEQNELVGGRKALECANRSASCGLQVCHGSSQFLVT